MKKLLVLAVLAALVSPALAKSFAFPPSNPAATVTIPERWTADEIDYGFSAKSPDGDVFFSVETVAAQGLDKMMEANNQWLADNKIVATGTSTEREIEINGLKATLVSMPAKDENGDTHVDFVFMQAPGNRVIMITLWASEAESKANAVDIEAIKRSIRPI